MPDFGDAPVVKLVMCRFLGVGVTALSINAKLPFSIGHAPGHMFITDIPNEQLARTHMN